MDSKVKYRIEKIVSYSSLKGSNLCFASTLNKFVEPSCLSDALCGGNRRSAEAEEAESEGGTVRGRIQSLYGTEAARLHVQGDRIDHS